MRLPDDTTLFGCTYDADESVYRDQVFSLVYWCVSNNRTLNNDKSKKRIIDFRRIRLIKVKNVETAND